MGMDACVCVIDCDKKIIKEIVSFGKAYALNNWMLNYAIKIGISPDPEDGWMYVNIPVDASTIEELFNDVLKRQNGWETVEVNRVVEVIYALEEIIPNLHKGNNMVYYFS